MGIEAIYAVEDAQQRGFSAAGRTDEGRNLAIVERYIDGFERFVIPVVEVQIPNEDLLGELAGVIRRSTHDIRDG
jgi:hypothetical protein